MGVAGRARPSRALQYRGVQSPVMVNQSLRRGFASAPIGRLSRPGSFRKLCRLGEDLAGHLGDNGRAEATAGEGARETAILHLRVEPDQ